MANRKAATMVQPPVSLVPPTSWTPDEKRFVQQLDSVIKDIYRRWGRLGLADLSIALRGAFDRTVSVDDFESIFKQTADSLSVQFGTPGEVQGPTLEFSQDRFYARVPALDIVITDASGQAQIARLRSVGNRFHMERISALDVQCPSLLRVDTSYPALTTQDKTVTGAISELNAKIAALDARVTALEP